MIFSNLSGCVNSRDTLHRHPDDLDTKAIIRLMMAPSDQTAIVASTEFGRLNFLRQKGPRLIVVTIRSDRSVISCCPSGRR